MCCFFFHYVSAKFHLWPSSGLGFICLCSSVKGLSNDTLQTDLLTKARHNPIPIPFRFKEPVKQALLKDVERGIIVQVPVSMPTDWCSTMVITAKKNSDPRRTVDYQHLRIIFC